MKVQGIDYGPELKIKNDQVARLANQRALLTQEIKTLYDKRFLLNSQIIGLEDKRQEIEQTLHSVQRQIFEIHDAARKESQMTRGEHIAKWMEEGKSDDEIMQLLKQLN